MEQPPTSQTLLCYLAVRGQVHGLACAPKVQVGFVPTVVKMGKVKPGAQPCLIPRTKGTVAKVERMVHAAAVIWACL